MSNLTLRHSAGLEPARDYGERLRTDLHPLIGAEVDLADIAVAPPLAEHALQALDLTERLRHRVPDLPGIDLVVGVRDKVHVGPHGFILEIDLVGAAAVARGDLGRAGLRHRARLRSRRGSRGIIARGIAQLRQLFCRGAAAGAEQAGQGDERRNGQAMAPVTEEHCLASACR